jgi:hypothetical protein
MELIRPNGLIERLRSHRRFVPAPEAYGRPQPGRSSREAVELAARQDRRGRRRRRDDPERGHLIDLMA